MRAAERGARGPIGGAGRRDCLDHWLVSGGARPALSVRLALIELGLSFDFEWGERAVLRVGKNYRRDPIPSVIGIIQYTHVLIQLCGCEPSRVSFTISRTRPARRGVSTAI